MSYREMATVCSSVGPLRSAHRCHSRNSQEIFDSLLDGPERTSKRTLNDSSKNVPVDDDQVLRLIDGGPEAREDYLHDYVAGARSEARTIGILDRFKWIESCENDEYISCVCQKMGGYLTSSSNVANPVFGDGSAGLGAFQAADKLLQADWQTESLTQNDAFNNFSAWDDYVVDERRNTSVANGCGLPVNASYAEAREITIEKYSANSQLSNMGELLYPLREAGMCVSLIEFHKMTASAPIFTHLMYLDRLGYKQLRHNPPQQISTMDVRVSGESSNDVDVTLTLRNARLEIEIVTEGVSEAVSLREEIPRLKGALATLSLETARVDVRAGSGGSESGFGHEQTDDLKSDGRKERDRADLSNGERIEEHDSILSVWNRNRYGSRVEFV